MRLKKLHFVDELISKTPTTCHCHPMFLGIWRCKVKGRSCSPRFCIWVADPALSIFWLHLVSQRSQTKTDPGRKTNISFVQQKCFTRPANHASCKGRGRIKATPSAAGPLTASWESWLLGCLAVGTCPDEALTLLFGVRGGTIHVEPVFSLRFKDRCRVFMTAD